MFSWHVNTQIWKNYQDWLVNVQAHIWTPMPNRVGCAVACYIHVHMLTHIEDTNWGLAEYQPLSRKAICELCHFNIREIKEYGTLE